MKEIPEEFQDLLLDESKAPAYLSTLMKDGSPQVTPIWFNTSGAYILINSVKGRVKDRNMRSRPQIALVIQDTKNQFRYVQVRGQVVDITEDGADTHINTLAKKYLGLDKHPFRVPGDVRVIYKILPESVNVHR